MLSLTGLRIAIASSVRSCSCMRRARSMAARSSKSLPPAYERHRRAVWRCCSAAIVASWPAPEPHADGADRTRHTLRRFGQSSSGPELASCNASSLRPSAKQAYPAHGLEDRQERPTIFAATQRIHRSRAILQAQSDRHFGASAALWHCSQSLQKKIGCTGSPNQARLSVCRPISASLAGT